MGPFELMDLVGIDVGTTKVCALIGEVGRDGRLTIIAGPCVVESPEHAMMMARECRERAAAQLRTCHSPGAGALSVNLG
jgi:3-deoxy-D-arabino-heptulosonate 7-phosphate (DAHP) synthase